MDSVTFINKFAFITTKSNRFEKYQYPVCVQDTIYSTPMYLMLI